MESIIFISIAVSSIGVFALPGRNKAFYSLLLHGLLVLTASSWAIRSLAGDRTILFSLVEGWAHSPQLSIDSLSAYFLLMISITMLTGMLYAFGYLKPYRMPANPASKPDVNLSVHHLALLWLHISMILVATLRGGKGFLAAWELMALSSFALILFHSDRPKVVRVALRYLIQMQLGFTLIAAAFVYVRAQGLLFGFDGVATYLGTHHALPLFVVFFIGFGITAGFVPVHTWLANTHLVAPSHVSGMMSGALINMGLYGLLRVLTGIHSDRFPIGLTLLLVSMVTSLYGVVRSAQQKDLKRLLAYSSIQHVGLIGIGIGLGMIGLALNLPLLAGLSFTAGMLHILNHSLIKALLFYGSGSVYVATHTRDLDQLGGLWKRMPKTAMLFLTGAVALCGLPPLNGFLSAFMLYRGLFGSLATASPVVTGLIITTIAVLLIQGVLSILVAWRAFNRIFSGTPRSEAALHAHHDPTMLMLLPETLLVGLMLLIAFWPTSTLTIVAQILAPFTRLVPEQSTAVIQSMQSIGIVSAVVVMALGVVYGCRSLMQQRVSHTSDNMPMDEYQQPQREYFQ